MTDVQHIHCTTEVGTKKPHVSASQLDMYWRCPEQYRRRYIEHEVLLPGIALLTGRGVHRGAEVNFRQKIESHEDLPVGDIIDAAVGGFETDINGGYALSADEAARGANAVLGEAKDQTAALARCHATEQAPDYQPVAVEHTTRIIFPRATHDLLGITDLRDDQRRVIDLKTAARRMPADTADKSIQLTIYAAAHQVDTGKPASEVRLDVLTKTKTPARQVLRSGRSTADYGALIHCINATLDGIHAGVFTPASPGSWCCSPKWCGYWRTCRFVNAERQYHKGE